MSYFEDAKKLVCQLKRKMAMPSDQRDPLQEETLHIQAELALKEAEIEHLARIDEALSSIDSDTSKIVKLLNVMASKGE